MSGQLSKREILRDIKERMHQGRERRFAKLLNDTQHWFMKEQDKMSYTTEQLKNVDWNGMRDKYNRDNVLGYVLQVSPGMTNLYPKLGLYSVSASAVRMVDNHQWMFPAQLAASTMQLLAEQCTRVDAFIERELNKKWMPIPPEGCEWQCGPRGIEALITLTVVDVDVVERNSSLLAAALIERDGAKHIDPKTGKLIYIMTWQCEEVE